MNNRKNFRPASRVKPGIDTRKCLQLIIAADDGNTEEVVRLASDPEVDINFIADIPGSDHKYQSALIAALINNHVQIVLFLLQQGATVEDPACGYYYDFHLTRSALSLSMAIDGGAYNGGYRRDDLPSTDLSMFKPLLRATKILRHRFMAPEENTSGTLIGYLTLVSQRFDPHRTQRLHLFFHELVVRGEIDDIDEFLQHNKSIEFNSASCQEYLKDIDLTIDQALRACNLIDHLAAKAFISKETAQQIKSTINAKVTYGLELNEFPIELQKSLAKPSMRSLQELFAEFQHWLLPDEGLPSVLVDNPFFREDDYVKTKEEIHSLQDPKRLRHYLGIDPSEFLTILYDAMSPKGENTAAQLLAELLRYHRSTLLDDKKPLFNPDQEKSCFFVLKRLYNLSESEKLTLISHRRHKEEVRELRYKNAVLQQQVEDSKAMLDDSNKKIEELEAKFSALLTQFQKLAVSSEASSVMPASSSPGLFKGAPTPRS